jgi:hypothetical protein
MGNSRLFNLTQSPYSEDLWPLPYIGGNNTTFYHHPIRTFDFTELHGKEKWTAYKFTKNVYDILMPTHLKESV